MKKSFKRENEGRFKGNLFDETTNTMFHPDVFTKRRKRLSKKQLEKCLADLGSGSETEYESASTLTQYGVESPIFLDWLIKCCEDEDTFLNSYLCWAFVFFKEDKRVLPAIIKSFSKCEDEDLGNYPQMLGIFGGEDAKKALKERFTKSKDNPDAFKKNKDWNNLGMSLLSLCEVLLEFEPDNLEVAKCLAKLSKHPNSFNKETALYRVVGFHKKFLGFQFDKTIIILGKALDSFSRTNNPRIFGILLPYLFLTKPEKTYQKFKRLYLKTKKEDRYNHLASSLIYSVDNSLFWISKLVRELPQKDSEHFRDYLNMCLVKPLNNNEAMSAVKEGFNSESPSTRISSVHRLKNLSLKDANKVLNEALADEPDEFIRKEFEKHLKKLEKQKV